MLRRYCRRLRFLLLLFTLTPLRFRFDYAFHISSLPIFAAADFLRCHFRRFRFSQIVTLLFAVFFMPARTTPCCCFRY